MKFWLDTCDLPTLQKAASMNFAFGISTDEEMLQQANQSFEKWIEMVAEEHGGPFALEIRGKTTEQMIRNAQKLFHYSNDIVAKIPAEPSGYAAMFRLSRQGIPTMATQVWTTKQGIVAANAGAAFVAPEFAKMHNMSMDVWNEIIELQTILLQQKSPTRLVLSALNQEKEVLKAFAHGIPFVTLKKELFEQIIQPHTNMLDSTLTTS